MRSSWPLGIVMLFVVSGAALADLPAAVLNALEVRNVPTESLSIYVEDVDSGEVVLRWHDEETAAENCGRCDPTSQCPESTPAKLKPGELERYAAHDQEDATDPENVR